MKIIQERRSVRRYKPDIPKKEVIMSLIDAARYAPSATNLQPWLFIVITNNEIKEKMAKAVYFKLKKIPFDIEMIGGKDIKEFGQKHFLFFRNAPVIIASIYRPYPRSIKLGYEQTQEETERKQLLGVESASAAVQNILLAAHAMGLGACWLDGVLVAKKELEEILKITSHWELMCLITIGYPDETPPPPRRKKIELIARYIT